MAPEDLPVSPNPYPDQPSIDWRAVTLGATLAIAASVILGALAIGFIGRWAFGAAAFGFAAGGYTAGRMRASVEVKQPSNIHDVVHGLGVWALGVLGLAILFALIGTPFAAREFSPVERTAAMVDALFRPLPVAPAEIAGASAQGSTMAAQGGTHAYDPGDIAAERDEVGRILRYGTVRGRLSADDRAHIGRLIAMNSDLTQGEAERRVDNVMADAAREADGARANAGAMTVWFAVAALVAAAVAVWAARLGGRHRSII